MGLGICVVGVGLLVGLTYDKTQVELAYLAAGGLIFLVGQALSGTRS